MEQCQIRGLQWACYLAVSVSPFCKILPTSWAPLAFNLGCLHKIQFLFLRGKNQLLQKKISYFKGICVCVCVSIYYLSIYISINKTSSIRYFVLSVKAEFFKNERVRNMSNDKSSFISNSILLENITNYMSYISSPEHESISKHQTFSLWYGKKMTLQKHL